MWPLDMGTVQIIALLFSLKPRILELRRASRYMEARVYE